MKVTKKIEQTHSIEEIRKLCHNDNIEMIILLYQNQPVGFLTNEVNSLVFREHNDDVVALLKALKYIDTNNLTYRVGYFTDEKGE